MTIQSTSRESILHQNRFITLLMGAVFAAPCLSYAVLGDAPLIAIITVFFLTLPLLKKRPVAITVRSVIYSLTLSLIFTVVLSLTYPVDGDRFFSPLPTEILFPFVISIGVCLAFFPQTQVVITIALTLSLFAMMLQGSCVNDPTNVRLVIESEFWGNRFWVFGFFLFAQMCTFIPLLYVAQEKRKILPTQKEKQRTRTILYGGSISLLVCLIVASCILATKVERAMAPVFNSVLTLYMSSFQSKVVFGDEVNLYRKIGAHVQKYKDRIVLRAKSKTPPGYLRGRVYTSYSKGKWRNEEVGAGGLVSLPFKSDDSATATRSFYRGKRKPEITDKTTSIDVLPSRFFYSNVLLTPGNTELVEIVSESLESTKEGVLLPKSWDRDAGYKLVAGHVQNNSAYQEPTINGETIKGYLTISDSKLQIKLKQLGTEILKNSSKGNLRKILEIEHYLQENFNYSLETDLDDSLDPVWEFLTVAKSGHCELFATSAALLLRSQGIATRYVTGFVALEPHPRKDSWVARLGDCHAWVEAWLPDQEEWVLVEPTPPIGIPQGTYKIGRINSLKESVFAFWKDIYAQVKRGYMAEAVLGIISSIMGFLFWLFWTGPGYTSWGIVALALIIWFRFLIKKMKRLENLGQSNVEDFNSVYIDIASYLKKLGINRTKTMSIRDLINLTQEKNIPTLSEVISILNEYEFLRYRPCHPEDNQIKYLKDRVRQWKINALK